ncbi:hypothetical protein [Nonomuraea sp. SBT364]|uniref:hypothetical protein n=1 Tax=Nonomuraea sp. SBT364 TaxID=1580530 RepID=UPI00066EF492|nr:hypothetical protein [Nonomuraea sp. SBT364]
MLSAPTTGARRADEPQRLEDTPTRQLAGDLGQAVCNRRIELGLSAKALDGVLNIAIGEGDSRVTFTPRAA